MTEDEAQTWVVAHFGSASADRLSQFADLLIVENGRQNLIAPSTVAHLWVRHLVDSAQLLALVSADWHHWVDIGSGAGLPGLVIAILSGRRVTMVEPRRLRVEFLNHCVDALGLSGIAVVQAKAENADIEAPDVVSARAVAKLDALFTATHHFTPPSTIFVFPKGASAQSEVATALRSWQGVFHVKQSIVDPQSGIVVATGVTPR